LISSALVAGPPPSPLFAGGFVVDALRARAIQLFSRFPQF